MSFQSEMSQYLDKVFLYLFIYGNNGQNILFVKPYKTYNFIRFSFFRE